MHALNLVHTPTQLESVETEEEAAELRAYIEEHVAMTGSTVGQKVRVMHRCVHACMHTCVHVCVEWEGCGWGVGGDDILTLSFTDDRLTHQTSPTLSSLTDSPTPTHTCTHKHRCLRPGRPPCPSS